MFVYIFPAIFISLIGNVFAQPKVCNPIQCFNLLNFLFEPNESENACQKVSKLEKCIALCFAEEINNLIFKGLQTVKQTICEGAHDYILANRCESKHKYAFFVCLYDSLTSEAENKNVNKNLLKCRQASEGEHCDMESLSQCTSRSNYLSKIFLENFFTPIKQQHCTFSLEEIYDFEIKSLAHSKDYKSLADCFDKNSPYVAQCIPQKWTATNSLIGTHFQKYLCRAAQSFLDCLQHLVQDKCNNLENIFVAMSRSLSRYALPQCMEKDSHDIFPASTHHFTAEKTSRIPDDILEVPGLLPTVPPTNASSGTAVIQQRIVINANYHNKQPHSQDKLDISAAYSVMVLNDVVIIVAMILQQLQYWHFLL